MTTETTVHDPATPNRTGRAPGMSRTRWVSVLAGVVAFGPLVWGGYWWTHPDVFEDSGAGWRSGKTPVAKAVSHIGITYPQGPDGGSRVTFRGAPTANLTEGSAEAEIAFSVCRPRPGSDIVGVIGGDLSRYCSSHAPIRDGTSLALSGEVDGPADEGTGDYVVMTVRLTEPGNATVDRVDFEYALGADGFFRRGTDSVAVDVTLRAR